MDSKTIERLVCEKKLIPSAEFNAAPYFSAGSAFFEYFMLHDGSFNYYYASKALNDEICTALELYIGDKCNLARFDCETMLENKLSLEPDIKDCKRNMLLCELNRFKLELDNYADLKIPFDDGATFKGGLHSVIANNFDYCLTYWVEMGIIDFEHLNAQFQADFSASINSLVLLEKIKMVNARLQALYEDEQPTLQVKSLTASTQQKLCWLGSPAHLAFIVDLFIEKGYLEQPAPYAERSADVLLTHFDFLYYNPTKESLGKLLHKDHYPINDQTVIDRFNKIPRRNELKR
jgi:hypothetical protein